MKKKLISLLMVIALVVGVFTGCGASSEEIESSELTAERENSEETKEPEVTELLESTEKLQDSELSEQVANTENEKTTEIQETTSEASTFTYTDMTATMYAQKSVNVRSLPSADGEKLGALSLNQEVTVTGQCNETGWYRIEVDGQEMFVSNNYLAAEKVAEGQQAAGTNPGTASVDGFVDQVYNFYCDSDVVFYDAPSTSGNAIYTIASGDLLMLEAYNAQTGWYRTTYYTREYRQTVYCYGQNFLTREEYAARYNQGVDAQYASLSCVINADELANNFITTCSNDDLGIGCVHIKGQHHFGTTEYVKRCGERRFEAEREWESMYPSYGIKQPDGNIQYNIVGVLGNAYYSETDFKEMYPNCKIFDSYDDYKAQYDQYVLDEVMKVVNAQ